MAAAMYGPMGKTFDVLQYARFLFGRIEKKMGVHCPAINTADFRVQ